IAQVFQGSGTVQIAKADAGIESPEDLSGRKVGSWGYGNEYELLAALERADVEDDVELVQQDTDMNQLLEGQIDAAQATTYNEYGQLLGTVNPETGELYHPDDFTILDWDRHGTAM